MSTGNRVLIVGAGPVGLVAAANLVRHGIPVTVFEVLDQLGAQSRASTFHPPTLDMLDDLGFAQPLITQGLIAPSVQYRSKAEGILGTFDFGAISDLTRHPYRLQAEQYKLTRIIYDRLRGNRLFNVEFSKPITAVSQEADRIGVVIGGDAPKEQWGEWLIGADGARSVVRHELDIEFEGFTWPERFLVVTTPFDFDAHIADLASVTYFADPIRWHFLLRIPDAWRVMVPVSEDTPDDVASSEPYAREAMRYVLPQAEPCQIDHITLYRVHQRVAKSFRKGRGFLVGDAAHVNNPLGGMGMNGGIHDAMNLTNRLAQVIDGRFPESELDRYDLQRRQVTTEYVQTATIKNKRNLEARDETERANFREELRNTMADPARTRQFLERISMLASLRRASELG